MEHSLAILLKMGSSCIRWYFECWRPQLLCCWQKRGNVLICVMSIGSFSFRKNADTTNIYIYQVTAPAPSMATLAGPSIFTTLANCTPIVLAVLIPLTFLGWWSKWSRSNSNARPPIAVDTALYSWVPFHITSSSSWPSIKLLSDASWGWGRVLGVALLIFNRWTYEQASGAKNWHTPKTWEIWLLVHTCGIFNNFLY